MDERTESGPAHGLREAFGPLAVGAELGGGWVLDFVHPTPDRVRLGLRQAADARALVVWTAPADGEHGAGPCFSRLGAAPLSYERTELALPDITAAVGALTASLGGVDDLDGLIAGGLVEDFAPKQPEPDEPPGDGVEATLPGADVEALLAEVAAGEGDATLELTLQKGALPELRRLMDALCRASEQPKVRLRSPRFDGRLRAFAEVALPLDALAEELEGALAPALAAKRPWVEVAADADIPPCVLPARLDVFETLRDDAGRSRVSGRRGYTDACDACGLQRRCAGFSEPFVMLTDPKPTPIAALAGTEPATEDTPEDDDWREAIRTRLVGRPGEWVRLGDLAPADALPQRACTMPWTYLEITNPRDFGPCCFEYQKPHAGAEPGSTPPQLWNSAPMRAFREAVAAGDPARTCRESCPVWRSGTATLDKLPLQGGSREFVEAQLRTVDAIVAGSTELEPPPITVHCRPTTFCNYDCLMCSYGEIGTLADELPQAFYDALLELPVGFRSLDVSGGEPMASPVFRSFLTTFPFDRYPELDVFLVTNGSYLVPKLQEKVFDRPGRPRLTLVVSLNAATPQTYLRVNRGLSWDRIRENLDALRERLHGGDRIGSLRYSMVLLKSNHHEIRALAELAAADGVGFRFMLPHRNRNAESIMTDEAAMRASLDALEDVMARTWDDPELAESARAAMGPARVLERRLREGVLRLLPD